MELLVATWAIRLALIGAAAVGAISLSVGAPVLDAVERAIAVAFVFTFAGRQLIGLLESPQHRMLRLRARRNARRAKSGVEADAAQPAKDAKGSRAAARRSGRSSTAARSA